MKTAEDCLTAARIKSEHGWTDRLIRKLLGEPDALAPNPRYKRAAPMRLYSVDRVRAAEATEEFNLEIGKTKGRQASAALGVSTKQQNMLAAMQSAEIRIVSGKTNDEIRELAYRTHGGNYMGDPREFHWSNRTAINCIRHNLTNYEYLWVICNRGDTGRAAYECLRSRVDDLISATYPEYFVE